MKTKKILFLCLLSAMVCLSTCKKDKEEVKDVDNSDPFYQQISAETLKWIESYEAENQEIVYVNAANDTARLTVDYISENGTPFYIDCTRNNETVQCDYKTAVIGFPDEFDPSGKKIVLSIALIANYEVRIMPAQSGLVVSAARFDDDTKAVSTGSETHFEASYSADYNFSGSSYEVIIINTITTENLPTGGAVPPKRLVYAKNGGILIWDDYDGVTWNLVQ